MDSTPHWRLILNGKSAGDDAVRAAVTGMREAGVWLEVRVTWEGGDAQRYVAEAVADGVDAVIAGGGDGTLNEVASALAHCDAPAERLPALAVIPLGTANDFATAANIPVKPGDALRLLHTPAVPIDLLKVEANGRSHWVVNLASGGFGTQVTAETNEGLKKLLGGLAYVLTGLSRLGQIQPQQARMRGPGADWEGGFIALGIGNGRQAGGGQVLCPDAWVDDGLLDVTIVLPLQGEVLSAVGAAMPDGKNAMLEQVAVRKAVPWVEIEAAQPFTLNLDGEPVKSARFRIECVPGRIRMHLPADCPLRRNAATVGP
ncbi:lipid kinase YegS [Thermomonas sp. HDW16]|uniref:lipid kinase YegS n=1 Tax=Thermomonas sp. HDW16 TaxID=2714945 RepID=UPI001409ED86|nr:lipid kinase YegS [Thermomonas sp. HDW16]QIL21545.1 lipid kinase YegS [Thermomonas sp. HDW16]